MRASCRVSTSPPATTAAVGLDWRDSSHWSSALQPCVHCHERTHLRDEARCPSHKVCAEAFAAVRVHDARIDTTGAAA
jgi:hypothetical protein